MANQRKQNSKPTSNLEGGSPAFLPARGGFVRSAGLIAGRNSGGYRGKNTPANWKRFNP